MVGGGGGWAIRGEVRGLGNPEPCRMRIRIARTAPKGIQKVISQRGEGVDLPWLNYRSWSSVVRGLAFTISTSRPCLGSDELNCRLVKSILGTEGRWGGVFLTLEGLDVKNPSTPCVSFQTIPPVNQYLVTVQLPIRAYSARMMHATSRGSEHGQVTRPRQEARVNMEL